MNEITQTLRGRLREMNDFQNVVAGQTARTSTRHGFLYKTLFLEFAGMTLAEIEEVRIKANNDQVIRSLSGIDLDVIASFDGYPDATAAGVLAIPFTRRKMKTTVGEALTGLNLGVPDGAGRILEELVIEVKIAATAAAPVLKAHVEVSDQVVTPDGPGLILRSFAYDRGNMVVGRNDITDLANLGQSVTTRMALNRLFLQVDPALLSKVRLLNNAREDFVTTPVVNEVLQSAGERTPIANWTVIDPSADGLSKNWFDLGAQLEEFRLELTALAGIPASLHYVAEYIGLLDV